MYLVYCVIPLIYKIGIKKNVYCYVHMHIHISCIALSNGVVQLCALRLNNIHMNWCEISLTHINLNASAALCSMHFGFSAAIIYSG